MRQTLLRRASVRHLAAVTALSGGLLAAATPALAAPAARSYSGHATRTKTYPYARANPGAGDPWGNYVRQCTSYASWYLASHGVRITAMGKLSGPKGSATLGDAKNWDKAAKAAGYQVSSRAVVGAIAQWHASERTKYPIHNGMAYFQAGTPGHVGVVTHVFPDGSAEVQDYNGADPLGPSSFRAKAPRYLLIHA